MVDTQVRPSDVTKYPIIEAMLTVPREAYVPEARRETAYVGDLVDLGHGRFILDPRGFAKLLDTVDVQREDVVLDIGCGLGYSSAVIAHMADAVVAVEIPELAETAQRLLAENGADNVAVIEGALAEGAARHGPYDVILIEGGVEVIPPAILDQLKEGGRIAAIFVEGKLGVCRVGFKLAGHVNWRFAFNSNAPLLAGFEREKAFTL